MKPLGSPLIRNCGTAFLLITLALCSHLIFLPQFFGLESAAFTYFGGDSTSQLIPAVSLLERNLLEGNIFWSWEYGLGADLYSEFSYYYTTSPFFYLQFVIKALFDAAGSDFYVTQQWRLSFSIIKEALCMGLMFSLLCKEKHGWLLSVCGAVIYGCSYWFIDNSFAFDFMTDAMIWPPLVIMALNRFYRCGSWLPLLATVAFSIANSFYFGYINCIFYVLFAVIFSSNLGKANAAVAIRTRLMAYMKTIGKLACIAVGAIGVAAVAFLPSVFAFLDADRVKTATQFEWWPTLDFIKVIPEALFFKGAEYSFLDLQTFAFPLAVLLVVLIDFRKATPVVRKKTILAVLMVVFWATPVMLSVMNGLSYPSNRWCYLVVFAVAYAFPDWMKTLEGQQRFSAKSIILLASVTSLFLVTHDWRTENALEETGYVFSGVYGSDILLFAVEIAFVAGLWLLQKQAASKNNNGESVKTGKIKVFSRSYAKELLSGTTLCAFLCATLLAMPYGPYAYVSGFRNNGGVMQFRDPEELSLLFEGDIATREAYAQLHPSNTEFYRAVDEETTRGYDFNGHVMRVENRSWINGSYPVSAYNSLITEQVNQWLKLDFCVTSTTKEASQYRGFGDRLFLENAWGVAYKINVDESSQLYGYKDSNNDGIWENSHEVGVDLWYDGATSEEEWQSWSFAQKDYALLQAGAVNDAGAKIINEVIGENASILSSEVDMSGVSSIDLSDSNVAFVNCSLGGTSLTAGQNAEIVINLPAQTVDGEYLLTFDLVRVDGGSFDMSVNGVSYWSSAQGSRWGYPIDTYAVAVGGMKDKITIAIREGDYTVSNVSLEHVSYESLDEWTGNVNRYSLENLHVDNNLIMGTINNQSEGILALSIPYNQGWTCIVDGNEVETFEVNGLFTGVALDSGFHEIELKYSSRPFFLGSTITFLTLIVLGAILLIRGCRALPLRCRQDDACSLHKRGQDIRQ